jgi:hypothetical protein
LRFLIHIKEWRDASCQDLCDRVMQPCARGHDPKEQGTMTVLTIAIWLALQFPAGILLGRMLQREVRRPVLIPVVARRRPRR